MPDFHMDEKLFQELQLITAKTDSAEETAWLPFWAHAVDTAFTIQKLLLRWLPPHVLQACSLPEESLQQLCMYLALVHDIGKVTPLFQARILALRPLIRRQLGERGVEIPLPTEFRNGDKSPHALAGQAVLLQSGVPRQVAAIVGCHHGKSPNTTSTAVKKNPGYYPQNYYGSAGKNGAQGKFWEQLRTDWMAFAKDKCGFSQGGGFPLPDVPAQLLLTGLLITADWIASNADYFPLFHREETGRTENMARRAQHAWERLDLPAPWRPHCDVMSPEGFENRFGFAPNEVQRQVLKICSEMGSPGILILEAQMGVGKTEAALAAAEILASRTGCGGLFFGLPTQATANGIFPRLKQWAEGQSQEVQLGIRLAHGMAELNEDYRSLFSGTAQTEEDSPQHLVVHEWFEGPKQALLADFVIGTIDQFLMASLKQKHVMLRHLGLAGKVVILDECHAYDCYMNQYLDRTLTWLGRYQVPVILLSATLPEQRRQELIRAYLNQPSSPDSASDWGNNLSYPLLTWTDKKEVKQEAIALSTPSTVITIHPMEESDLAEYLGQKLIQGGCAGVIVNTVKRTQKIAAELAQKLPQMRIILAHSRFIQPDRGEKERELLHCLGKSSTAQQRDRLIVVGTQVLEQSLDIDFDVLITDLCPMDLLLQRLGRLHRHRHTGRTRPSLLQRPECGVLWADGELEPGAKAIYGEWLLLRTKMLLPDTITLPADIPSLVQNVYRDPEPALLEDLSFRQAWEQQQKTIAQKEQKADTFRLYAPEAYRNDISNLLDTDLTDQEEKAKAAVRDSDPGLDVLLLVLDAQGQAYFLPWQEGGKSVPLHTLPSQEECRQILRQQISLPRVFCLGSNLDNAIRELEIKTVSTAPEWQQSRWLRKQLVLWLDQQGNATLCGYRLHYSKEQGLTYQKEEENETTGI